MRKVSSPEREKSKNEKLWKRKRTTYQKVVTRCKITLSQRPKILFSRMLKTFKSRKRSKKSRMKVS